MNSYNAEISSKYLKLSRYLKILSSVIIPSMRLVVALLTISLVISSGCTTNRDSDIRTSCGTVLRGEVFNPINPDNAEEGTITTVESQNLVVFRDRFGEATLVLLHGVAEELDNPAQVQRAKEFLESLDPKVYFFRAGETCDVDIDNRRFVPGNIVTRDGNNSYGELVVRSGNAPSSDEDRCFSRLVENCYTALEAESRS